MGNEVKKSFVNSQKKRRAVVFIAVVLALGIISGVVLAVLDFAEKYRENEKNNEPTNMYSDELHSYIFYEPDYDLDVTEVPEYMELDRLLYFKDGSEEFGISSGFQKYGKPVVFFKKYFDVAIAGDWETYNELFTEHYYETNKPRNQFAPQMIYDMHIEKLWQKIDEDGERYAFNVTYRIYRNNGTFRNDIESGASKTLYFELVNVGDELKIDRITYYV